MDGIELAERNSGEPGDGRVLVCNLPPRQMFKDDKPKRRGRALEGHAADTVHDTGLQNKIHSRADTLHH